MLYRVQVERGHFKELKMIVEWIRRHSKDSAAGHVGQTNTQRSKVVARQTFIFSATLFGPTAPPSFNRKGKAPADPLEYVAKLCDLREGYSTLDLSRANRLANGEYY